MNRNLKKKAVSFMVVVLFAGVGAAPSFAKQAPVKNESLNERKTRVRERLEQLKETDPEKFKEVSAEILNYQKEYLLKLKKEDPKKFKEIMKNQKPRLE